MGCRDRAGCVPKGCVSPGVAPVLAAPWALAVLNPLPGGASIPGVTQHGDPRQGDQCLLRAPSTCQPGAGRAEGMWNPLPVEGTRCREQVGCGTTVVPAALVGLSLLCPHHGQRMPVALQVLCSHCGAAKPPSPQSPVPPPWQPPHAPTLSLQRRNNLEKPWQPQAVLGMPAARCPQVPPHHGLAGLCG